ncbi:MAG: hypothetical protein Q8N81_02265 [bacterium]|nr:hypothetical protein [bacterium]
MNYRIFALLLVGFALLGIFLPTPPGAPRYVSEDGPWDRPAARVIGGEAGFFIGLVVDVGMIIAFCMTVATLGYMMGVNRAFFPEIHLYAACLWGQYAVFTALHALLNHPPLYVAYLHRGLMLLACFLAHLVLYLRQRRAT